MLDSGNDVFGEAARQVSVGGHESGEAESGVDHPADEGMVIGGSPSVGDGDGAIGGKNRRPRAGGEATDISRAILRRRALMRDLI